MRMFRLLNTDEIECRVSEIDKQGRYLRLLLYKTARTDSALLDETVGPMNWSNDYRTIDGKMYCGIGIRSAEHGEWIWKWNVGTESNMEAEKGEASDSMKRAGFVWGIGAELYTAPAIKVSSDKCNIKDYNGKFKCYDRFSVGSIQYTEQGTISRLIIYCNGIECFTWRGVATKKQEPPKKQEPTEEAPKEFAKAKPVTVCELCGAKITGVRRKDGSIVTADEMAARAKAKYGQVVCKDCAKILEKQNALDSYAQSLSHEDAGDRV